MRPGKVALAALTLGATTPGVSAVGIEDIIGEFHVLTNKTELLADALDAWRGSLVAAIPINQRWQAVLKGVNHAADTISQSELLDMNDLIELKPVNDQLALSVQDSLFSLVRAKPKFDKLNLAPKVLDGLKTEQAGSEKLAANLVDKTDPPLRPVVEVMVQAVLGLFNDPIKAFGG